MRHEWTTQNRGYLSAYVRQGWWQNGRITDAWFSLWLILLLLSWFGRKWACRLQWMCLSCVCTIEREIGLLSTRCFIYSTKLSSYSRVSTTVTLLGMASVYLVTDIVAVLPATKAKSKTLQRLLPKIMIRDLNDEFEDDWVWLSCLISCL